SYVYNGQGVSFLVYSGLVGTLAVPIVGAFNKDGRDFFFAAPFPGTGSITSVQKYTMTEAGRSQQKLTGPVAIAVPAYQTPPLAPQTCSGADSRNLLDTLDARFQSPCYQNAPATAWCVHTVAFNSGSGFPAPEFYE